MMRNLMMAAVAGLGRCRRCDAAADGLRWCCRCGGLHWPNSSSLVSRMPMLRLQLLLGLEALLLVQLMRMMAVLMISRRLLLFQFKYLRSTHNATQRKTTFSDCRLDCLNKALSADDTMAARHCSHRCFC
jgi:hypothetical protein